ncbi:MAG: DUF2057 family protein [Pontibacterium sp.]
MNYLSAVFSVLLFFLCLPVFAEVTVEPAEGVIFLAVDGNNVPGKGVFSDNQVLMLDNGQHQIVARYMAELKVSPGEYESSATEAFVILFSARDQVLTLGLPEIESKAALQRFNATGNWTLINRRGVSYPVKTGILAKEGFQLARDYGAELQAFNQKHSGSAAPMEKLVQLPVIHHKNADEKSGKSDSLKAQSASQEMAEAMLKYWYSQADKLTQKKFKQWINP